MAKKRRRGGGTDAVVDKLNALLAADPAAISTIITNRVPCNVELAACCETVIVQGSPTMGGLSVINSALEASGQDRVLIEVNEKNHNEVVRFTRDR